MYDVHTEGVPVPLIGADAQRRLYFKDGWLTDIGILIVFVE